MREPREEAIGNVVKEIKHYVSVHGKQDKYHHTLTIAAMLVLARRMGSPELRTFKAFLSQHPELLTDLKGILEHHYSPNRLFSPEAAREWMEPDLSPF